MSLTSAKKLAMVKHKPLLLAAIPQYNDNSYH
ncbi:Uncharacterised protein [Yersinia intermedia]|nr:Uncharacterised protein [Yersinia intermedia]CNH76293.1 Uncharacterised protein [Yersinia intermedia]CRF07426.1 Uncharacterised protein [Yersinia intermedia]